LCILFLLFQGIGEESFFTSVNCGCLMVWELNILYYIIWLCGIWNCL